MNNNTKIRLRLSKNLFESLTREILAEAKKWFSSVIVANHIKNTKKLSDPKKLDINFIDI